jgi:hypothetical protein
MEIDMTLYEEIYFDITIEGKKSDAKRLEKFLLGGGCDDFFEVHPEHISYADEFVESDESATVRMFFSDDLGIELDELDTDEFLEVLCRAAVSLDLTGHIYDINDDEYSFRSEAGSSDFYNAKNVRIFNDELDDAARSEEVDDED